MIKVHLLHGIHSKDGGAPAKLRPYFERHGFEVAVYDYGWASGLLSRFQNGNRARLIAKHVGPRDIVVGHSNGGCLAWMVQQRVPVFGLILIHPALDEDARFPKAKWVDVIHGKSDTIVEFSEVLGFFDFFKHPYGRLGRVGYRGNDKHVVSIDDERLTMDLAKMAAPLPALRGHSDLFEPKNIEPWGDFLARRARAKAEAAFGAVAFADSRAVAPEVVNIQTACAPIEPPSASGD